jgi:hypothetical protein
MATLSGPLLKRPVPKPLFKYASGKRAAQILRDKTIRFTQPKYFNDPFEFSPSLDIDTLKSVYFDHPLIKNRISSGEARKNVLNGFAEFAREVANNITAGLNNCGVLSLSKRCDIPLMWSHYAENHTGIVIGFNVDGGLYTGNEIGDLADLSPEEFDTLSDVGAVYYSKTKAPYPDEKNGILTAAYTKDECWAYEEEWRVVRNLKTLNLAAPDIFVSNFSPESVRCVIMGARTPREIEDEVHQLLRDQYHHVHLLAASLDADAFTMDISSLMSEMLRRQDYELESYDHPNVRNFYHYISEGKFFKSLEMIDAKVAFGKSKDELNYNP